MKEEITMINKNQTWTLTDKPPDKRAIGLKWVFKTKLNPDRLVNKLKARLVVKGYAQVEGVDFGETFAPVARIETIRLLLALVAEKGWTQISSLKQQFGKVFEMTDLGLMKYFLGMEIE
ncbi:hypothetical protein K2173_019515 [Erythroxylum novogranatense]|uniref:Reverse transcriptase Ty1/copia-type domain-containing protein n=1 Tax=Erythroxylum novogranatense TaxID=1862640 RepID=A0AAV8UCS5_9ROSI|nr:hypothetical protein K2173_019515 [Erythroxylum novogranatense]